MTRIPDDLLADLCELVEAADAHKKATEEFLSAPMGGGHGQGVLDPWNRNLQIAEATVTDKAHEVADTVRRLGLARRTTQ